MYIEERCSQRDPSISVHTRHPRHGTSHWDVSMAQFFVVNEIFGCWSRPRVLGVTDVLFINLYHFFRFSNYHIFYNIICVSVMKFKSWDCSILENSIFTHIFIHRFVNTHHFFFYNSVTRAELEMKKCWLWWRNSHFHDPAWRNLVVLNLGDVWITVSMSPHSDHVGLIDHDGTKHLEMFLRNICDIELNLPQWNQAFWVWFSRFWVSASLRDWWMGSSRMGTVWTFPHVLWYTKKNLKTILFSLCATQ